MPLQNVKTVYLIKELETDGHRAMKFLCSDGSIYYCKFRISMKKEEIDAKEQELILQYVVTMSAVKPVK